MVADAQRPLYTSATSAKANRKKTPLRKVDQLNQVADVAISLVEAAKVMREQVSRPVATQDGKPVEDPAEHRQEQRAAAGALAKIMMGLDKALERTRILQGKSLPPNLHTEPIPRKATTRPKPLNRPPPSIRQVPTTPQDEAT